MIVEMRQRGDTQGGSEQLRQSVPAKLRNLTDGLVSYTESEAHKV